MAGLTSDAWVAEVTGAMEILRRTVHLGESILFLYQGGDLRPREGKAMSRPGPE